ncbi:MAG: zf-HC2 domain-containing protein [Bacteroidales bacterium]|nr:zf-HC2 domain-containing protein [Bacteroidales bacterium]
MKCLDNELIQEFIDGQVNSETEDSIKDHIAKCATCTEKIEEQKFFISELKNAIDLLDEEMDIIPEFKKPMVQKFIIGFKMKSYLKYIAAASVILMVVYFIWPKEPKEDFVYIYYDLTDEFDANLPGSEQEYSYKTINNDGMISPF